MQFCILIQTIITTVKWMSDEKVIVGQQTEDSSFFDFAENRKINNESEFGCRLSFAPRLARLAHPAS